MNKLMHRRKRQISFRLLMIAALASFLLTACVDTKQQADKTPGVTTTAFTTTTKKISVSTQVPVSSLLPKPGKNAIFTLESYPRIDGSTVTIPISEAITAAVLDIPLDMARAMVLHNKTHEAYVNLIKGKTDVIFVTYASEEELALAKKNNVNLEFIPIVRDAFVFFVNKNNPVDNLSHSQIVDIYSGKIKNWKEVGGPDLAITAYQRVANSGSQSGMLELVMKGTPMMDAPTENRFGAMEEIIDAVAAYKNSNQAIGYSYYYFVNSMYFKDVIKLLSIDGIGVENANIEAEAYPFGVYYYAVLNKNNKNNENARKYIDFILSDEGQGIVESLGYVKLGK